MVLKNIPFFSTVVIHRRIPTRCLKTYIIFVTNPTGHRSVRRDYIYASSRPQVPKPDGPVVASAHEHSSAPVVQGQYVTWKQQQNDDDGFLRFFRMLPLFFRTLSIRNIAHIY